MGDETLEAFGTRWNKRLRGGVAFDPADKGLAPPPVALDIPAVDSILGGGVPRGRTTLLVGAESSGKTLLAQLVIAATQQTGGTAMYFDIERCFDERWFALTGVDTSPGRLIVLRPTTMEQTFDMITDALVTARPDVLVLDSVAALVPKDMLKQDMMKQDFRGLAARKITEGVKKITQYNQSTALVIINQLRTKMGVVFGSPETMPGGHGLRHAASLIVRTRRGAWLYAGDDDSDDDLGSLEDDRERQRAGFMLRLRTEKSKVSPPWQTAELKFYFTGEVDPLGSLVHLALQRGVIEQPSRGYFVLPGVEGRVHGRAAVEDCIREDAGLRERVIGAVREA